MRRVLEERERGRCAIRARSCTGMRNAGCAVRVRHRSSCSPGSLSIPWLLWWPSRGDSQVVALGRLARLFIMLGQPITPRSSPPAPRQLGIPGLLGFPGLLRLDVAPLGVSATAFDGSVRCSRSGKLRTSKLTSTLLPVAARPRVCDNALLLHCHCIVLFDASTALTQWIFQSDVCSKAGKGNRRNGPIPHRRLERDSQWHWGSRSVQITNKLLTRTSASFEAIATCIPRCLLYKQTNL